MPGIFSEMLAGVEGESEDDRRQLAYSMAEAAYREMSDKIDLQWEIEFLELAYEISEESHADVIRESGEAYFSHPLAVSRITLEEFPNPTTFKAIVALLHDVIEDAEDPLAKREEIVRRFREYAESKRSSLELSMSPRDADRKIAFMTSFAESVVEGVEMLSKKDKESYLHDWEKPFLAFEKAVSGMPVFPPLWWSPLVKPPMIWSRLMKDRADGEYFARFEAALSSRMFVSVLYVKLADRYHNLQTPKPSKSDKNKPDPEALKKLLHETESHYLPLAARLDPMIHRILEAECESLRAESGLVRLQESTRNRASTVLVPGFFPFAPIR